MKSIQVSFSQNVKGSVQINQCTLCACGLSNRCNSKTTKYTYLVFSGNNKCHDQLTKQAIFARYYYNYHNYYATSATSTTIITTETVKIPCLYAGCNKGMSAIS